MKKLKFLLASLLILTSLQTVFCQSNFIQINDASGQPPTQDQMDSLNAAVDDLILTIDIELPSPGQFKVFDIGFYLHERDYQGGFPEAFQRAKTIAASQSPYYLLFGRQTDDSGVNSQVWVDFVFPDDDFLCVDNSAFSQTITEIINKSSSSGYGAYNAEIESIKELNSFLKDGFCCSNYLAAFLSKPGDSKIQQRMSSCNINSALAEEIANDLLLDDSWLTVLEKVYDIYLKYKTSCDATDWKSKAELDSKGKGIVPHCLWTDLLSGVPYTTFDPPFVAGATDGLYHSLDGTVSGIYHLPSDIGGFVMDGRDYFLFHVFCRKKTWLTTELMANVLIKLKNIGTPSWLSRLDMFEDNAFVKAFFGPIVIPDEPQCQDEAFKAKYESINEAINFIYQVMTDWEAFKATGEGIWDAISNRVLEMYGDIDSTGVDERYYTGYYGGQAAESVLTGILKFGKLGKLIDWLKSKANRILGTDKKAFDFEFRKKFLDDFQKRKPYKDWKPPSKQVKFNDDFKGNEGFANWVLKNGDKIRAWEGLYDAPKWARLNTDILELIYREPGKIIDKFGEFYKVTMKNKTPSGFDGGEKYYNGIWYNQYGFPKFRGDQVFSPIDKVKINMNGNYTTDFTEAKTKLLSELRKTDPNAEILNKPLRVKYNGVESDQMTWHHMEDGETMQLVKYSVHKGKAHVGGTSIVNDYPDLKGKFPIN